MAGYTRQDTSNNIDNGNVIDAADLDAEFNQVESAFNSSTGHTHDGTSAEGAPITKVGPAQDLIVSATQVLPKTDNTLDLGSATYRFKQAYAVGFNGAFTGNLTGNVTGAVTGNADTATTLATGRTIALTGDVTATGVSFDGSANISLTTVVGDDSHNHTLAYITDAGTIASQNSNAVTITGGSISGITDLAVLDGGTGSSTAAGARTNLGVAIGSDVQAYDAGLASIAALTTAADKMVYTTALDTYAVTSLTSFARTLLDDADAATARTTLGVAIGSDVQAYDSETLKADTDDNVTAGYTATADNDGSKASGTYTPDPAGGNLKRITNDGAFTLAAPTASGDYTMVIQMTNGVAAGTVTVSGFSKQAGDSLTTTNGDDFFLFITKINGFTSLTVQALQ